MSASARDFAILPLTLGLAMAQVSSSTITGTVRDTSGGLVANAKVTFFKRRLLKLAICFQTITVSSTLRICTSEFTRLRWQCQVLKQRS